MEVDAMSLDRDELADALHEVFSWIPNPIQPQDRERVAKAISSALLARLRPEAVAPAASPAPYVPRVGDVVRHVNDDPGTDDRIVTESLCDGAFRMLSLRYSNLSSSGYNVAAFWRFVRRATSSERAAAGLPVDESAFDEAKEREAALDAYRAGTDGCIDPEGTKYPTCRDSFRNGWIARARVAAKGGA